MASVRSTSPAHSPNPLTLSSVAQNVSMMRCPKCGDEQEKSATCAKCGVVVEKYLEIKQSSTYEPATSGAVAYMNDVDDKVSAFPLKAMAAAGIVAIVTLVIFYLI